MGLLDNLRGRARKPPQLSDLVAAYPPYVPPFVARPADLTLPQAEANLAHLLGVRPARLHRFGTLLSTFGIDLDAGLAAASPEPLLDALWRWTLDQFPPVHDAALATYGARRTPQGSSPVFGVLTDLGLVLGECVIRHAGGSAWALDLDAGNRSMPSFRQPCVIGPTTFDAFHLAESAYANCRKGGYRFANDLRQTVMNCLAAAGTPGSTRTTSGGTTSGGTTSGGTTSGGIARGASGAHTLYDKAGDHIGEREPGDAPDDPGASHLALFVAWLARHDLLSATLAERTKPLKDGTARPLAWLETERDGTLAEADLNDAGNRFARQYFGTPADGLHDGAGSFLQDFIATLQGGNEEALVEDSWENYALLAPVMDRRYAAFLSAG